MEEKLILSSNKFNSNKLTIDLFNKNISCYENINENKSNNKKYENEIYTDSMSKNFIIGKTNCEVSEKNNEILIKEENFNNNYNTSSNLKYFKLANQKDDSLFTSFEMKSINNIKRNLFKTRDFGFLKKKKKKLIDQSNLDLNNNYKLKKISKNHPQETSKQNLINNKYACENINSRTSLKKNLINPKKIIFKTENANNKLDNMLININTISNKITSSRCKKIKSSLNQSMEGKELIKDDSRIFRYNYLNYNDSTKKIKIKWTEDEDKKLIKLKQDFPYLTWKQISQFFQNRSKIDCMNRYLKVINPDLKKGKWTKEEDEILKSWVENNGEKNWINLVKSNMLKGRNCKQIRDRWLNNLCSGLKKPVWDDIHEKTLLEKFVIYGTSWTQISSFIPNSSENIIKNKFYSMLRKVVNKFLNDTAKGIKNFDNKNTKFNSNFISSDESKFLTESDIEFIQKIKNKKKKIKYIEKDLTDTYLNIDNSYTKTNTVSHSTAQNNELSLNFNEKSYVNPPFEIDVADHKKKKNRKKSNYNLDWLLNFLPILLKEKGIDYDKITRIEDKKSAFKDCLKNDMCNKPSISDDIKTDFKNTQNISKINFINSLKKTFDKKKDLIRKEIIGKMKNISLDNFKSNDLEDKLLRVNSIFNNNEFFERNINWEKDISNFNSQNNLNNSLGNINNFNNKLQNFFFSNNNNISNFNDSFISNGDEFFDNIFNNNHINLNFSNSDLQNKNLSNSLNFSDLLELDNNGQHNNSNQSVSKNISFNNNIKVQEINSKDKNSEPKQNNIQTTGRLNRMKSSIMLNLQLNLLHKLVEKIKNNYVQKFFLNFKNNTLMKFSNITPSTNNIDESVKLSSSFLK